MSPIPSLQNLEYKTTVTDGNFDLLYNKYGSMIYGIVLKAVKYDSSAAEKLTGKAFVEVYRDIGNYNSNNQTFFIWMLPILMKMMEAHGYKTQLLSVIKQERILGDYTRAGMTGCTAIV